MKRKLYEAPHTNKSVVQLESGFMEASMFGNEDGHNEGVSIEGHNIGNSGNYFDGTDPENPDNMGWNEWD